MCNKKDTLSIIKHHSKKFRGKEQVLILSHMKLVIRLISPHFEITNFIEKQLINKGQIISQ